MLKLTSNFVRPPERSAPPPEPYGSETAVSYGSNDDGPLEAFEDSSKKGDIQRQYRVAVGKLEGFLRDKGSGSTNNRDAIVTLKQFAAEVDKGGRGRFAGNLERVYGEGKETIDALCVEIENEAIPEQVRAEILEQTARELGVCSNGVFTHLMKAVERLRLGLGGLANTARETWEELIDQTLHEFVRHHHAMDPHYVGNEIHYVNGYRNRLPEEFGAAKRTDTAVPKSRVSSASEECIRFMRQRATPAALVRALAERCLSEVHERFAAYRHRPLSMEEIGAFYEAYENQLETEFQGRYGGISPQVLVNEYHGHDLGEEGDYSLIEHPELLMRSIAVNLHGAGVLVAPEFPAVGTTPHGGHPIRKMDEGVYYVEVGASSQAAGYRPLGLSDIDPELAPPDLVGAALTNTKRELLAQFPPQPVWKMISAGGDMIERLTDRNVRRYRAANPDNDRYIRDQFVAAAKDTPRVNDLFYALLDNEEPTYALHMLPFVTSVDMIDRRTGNSPLHLAVKQGAADVVDALLDRTDKLSARNGADDTPLMMAARSGDEMSVAMLVLRLVGTSGKKASPASLDEKNKSGQTALMWAARKGHDRVVAMLANAGADVNARDLDGATPLIYAARYGRLACVDTLIKTGAKVNACTTLFCADPGFSALIAAAEQGHVRIVETLLRNGKADPNQRDWKQRTPLVRALLSKQLECALVMYLNGADPDRGEPLLGLTPLATIVEQTGDADAVRFLLQAKADVNKIGGGYTPLMKAALVERVDMIDLLIDEGKADPHLMGLKGETALTLVAGAGKYQSVAALLRRVEADRPALGGRTALMAAAEAGDIEMMRQLLAAGADLNRQDFEMQRTPLMRAAAEGHLEAVQFLLDAGADPWLKTVSRKTALDIASGRGHDEVIRLLNAVPRPETTGRW